MSDQVTAGLEPSRLSDDSIVTGYQPELYPRTGASIAFDEGVSRAVGGVCETHNLRPTESPGEQLAELVRAAVATLNSLADSRGPAPLQKVVLNAALCGINGLAEQIQVALDSTGSDLAATHKKRQPRVKRQK